METQVRGFQGCILVVPFEGIGAIALLQMLLVHLVCFRLFSIRHYNISWDHTEQGRSQFQEQ